MQVLSRVRSSELSVSQGVLAALAGAVATAILAQIRFYLPDNPVPVTMQCFAVVCCGLLLGKRWGTLSQAIYAGAGFAGAPVFAGFKAGVAGPTMGYLLGFVVAAFVVGLMMDMAQKRTFYAACVAGMAGIAVIYLCGAGWLGIWLRFAGGEFAGWAKWALGVAPFVLWDAAKVFAAALVVVGRK